MKRRLLVLFMSVGILSCFTGCTKDNMEDIVIITTSYPIEYITEKLYGNHALIHSVYPDGTDIRTHEVTEKQLDDYSKKELFIYNGLGSDRDIATSLLERNKDLKIIDSSFGMELTYTNMQEELWLNPSHLLMMAQNIKTGLSEYISSTYLQKEIDEIYQTLKVELSELDAEIKLTAENANNKTIVVASNAFKFLEKYGFQVISLADETILQKTIDDVKAMISNGEISYVFLLEYESVPELAQSIIDETKVATLTYRRIDNITEQERDSGDDYIKIMNQNIDLLKQELYQ